MFVMYQPARDFEIDESGLNSIQYHQFPSLTSKALMVTHWHTHYRRELATLSH